MLQQYKRLTFLPLIECQTEFNTNPRACPTVVPPVPGNMDAAITPRGHACPKAMGLNRGPAADCYGVSQNRWNPLTIIYYSDKKLPKRLHFLEAD